MKKNILLALTSIFLSTAICSADVTPKKLSVSKDGDSKIFIAEFSVPADYIHSPTQAYGGVPVAYYLHDAPRSIEARLIGSDPWSQQIFPLFRASNLPDAAPTELAFIGRVTGSDRLSLRLDYTDANGIRKNEPVTLDLSGAKPIAEVVVPAAPTPFPAWRPGGVPTPKPKAAAASYRLSPLQQWAKSRADWLESQRFFDGDLGGFYTYASAQTREKYSLENISTSSSWTPGSPLSADDTEHWYETTSGAMSLQESLQLDRMQPQDHKKEVRKVDIKTISGLTTASLPFDQMRGGKEPTIDPLTAFVPKDNYFLGFRDIAKMFDFFDFLDQWGSQFLSLYEPSATDYGVRAKLHEQLCLPNSALSKIFGPALIDSVAITGSDPFLREGSDVAVLFDVKQKDIFNSAVQASFDAARSTNTDAAFSTEDVSGVKIESLQTPDRRISCHRAWLKNVMVYSNSKAALKRILNANAQPAESLAATPDYKYARAVIYPYDQSAEDGFLFLSDDFMRALASPQTRIKEKRRLEAITSLKMLANAYLFEGFERGAGNYTLNQLLSDKAVSKDDYDIGDGDTFAWNGANRRATSATYGSLAFLTPLVELPIDKVSAAEQTSYTTFKQNYESYWRRYFDPVALRIRDGKNVGFDLAILPLIDQTGYQDLRDITGGNPITLHLSEVPEDTLLRVMLHLNPNSRQVQSFKQFAGGMVGSMTPQLGAGAPSPTRPILDWIGEWITFWIEDSDAYTAMLKHYYEMNDHGQYAYDREFANLFDVGFVLGIQTKNPLAAAGLLVSLRSIVQTTAPGMVIFSDLEPYKNVTIVQIAPDPRGPWYQELSGARPTADGTPPPTTSPEKLRKIQEQGIFYASVQGALYFSTKASALRKLIDKFDDSAAVGASAANDQGSISGHTLAYVAGGNKKAMTTARYYIEQIARDACVRNFGPLYALGRAGVFSGPLKDGAETSLLGYRAVCPGGGGYSYDPASDTISSDTYGSEFSLTRRDEAAPESPAGRLVGSVDRVVSGLSFDEHGLSVNLRIERK